MAGQDFEERTIAVPEGGLDDVVEIPDGLMVMDGEEEDGMTHSSSSARM
jgi:hypothetical protein